jgi:hypothetical protein
MSREKTISTAARSLATAAVASRRKTLAAKGLTISDEMAIRGQQSAAKLSKKAKSERAKHAAKCRWAKIRENNSIR